MGVVLIASLLMYSQSIVNKLRDDNLEIVQLYAEIIAATVRDVSDANFALVESGNMDLPGFLFWIQFELVNWDCFLCLQ